MGGEICVHDLDIFHYYDNFICIFEMKTYLEALNYYYYYIRMVAEDNLYLLHVIF